MADANRRDRDEDRKRSERQQSHESPSAEAARTRPNAPMTWNQAARIRALSAELGEPAGIDRPITAAEADMLIGDLQNRAGYGGNPPKPIPEKPKGM